MCAAGAPRSALQRRRRPTRSLDGGASLGNRRRRRRRRVFSNQSNSHTHTILEAIINSRATGFTSYTRSNSKNKPSSHTAHSLFLKTEANTAAQREGKTAAQREGKTVCRKGDGAARHSARAHTQPCETPQRGKTRRPHTKKNIIITGAREKLLALFWAHDQKPKHADCVFFSH